MCLIDSKYIINIDNFSTQVVKYRCPKCGQYVFLMDIIGFGTFKISSHEKILGVGFKCPKCLTKSSCRADENIYILYDEYMIVKEEIKTY